MSTTNDKELLERAAKAAGIQYDPNLSEPHENGTWWGLWLKYDREPHEFDRRHWNPLRDDGDALRLAVQLAKLGQGLNIFMHSDELTAYGDAEAFLCRYEDDAFAATRRTIVHAAAAIGKAML